MMSRYSIGCRRILPAVAILMAAGLVWGISTSPAASPSSSASPSGDEVALRIGWTSEPDNLNPFIGYANVTFEFYVLQYQSLFGTGTDGKPTLDLAAEFPTEANGGVSPDGKTWTIKIRPGVKWQDGEPLTAEDVAWTFNYVIDNQMANLMVQMTNLKHVEAVDPTTVRMICSRPKADMEYVFVPILPKHIWRHVTPSAAETSYMNKPPIVGSGPFQAVAFKKGGYLEMVRNPYYSGKQPTVDKIVFQMYQNPDTMTADLRSGTLDAAWGILPAQYPPLKSLEGIQAVDYIYFNWDYLDFNCYAGKSYGHPALRDWRFRHALGYALDREKLATIALGGYAETGTTILPPGMWFDPDFHWEPPADAAYSFDLAKADQLLTAAGYPKDKNGARLYKGKPITLRLWCKADTVQEQSETKLIAGWLKQLGIRPKVSVLELGAIFDGQWNYEGDTYAPDFDLVVSDWMGYTDPGQTMSVFTTPMIGSSNETCWSNAEYDKLALKQASTLDRNKRKVVIDKMQQIMYEQAPWLVLTYPRLFEAYNTARWTGWTRVMRGTGPAFMTGSNVDSYLNLRPAAVTESSGGAKGVVWVVVGVAAVVVIGLVVWLVRRRGRALEE
jgi:peptide/nickel transport system substrate-binding protein